RSSDILSERFAHSFKEVVMACPLSVRGRIAALALTFVAALSLPAAVLGQPVRNGPLPSPLPLFPPDNWWNVDVSAAPLDPNSANFITFIGANDVLHPDFGGDSLDDPPPAIYGMPYISVPATQPLVSVTWMEFGSQSDDGF